MNIHQLECFVSLASTLNFAKTAEQLGLTQPAVSKQIRAMETELDATLFERSTRSVSLTPIGRRFLSEANDMLQIFYRAKQWIGSYDQSEKNVIRIGYSDPHAIQFISQALKHTRTDFSEKITPQLVLDQTDANLGRLQKDQIDFVIGMRDAKFDDHTITFTKINENSFKFIVSKEHPFAEKMLNVELSETYINDNRNINTKEHIVFSKSFRNIRQILAIPPYLLKHFSPEDITFFRIMKIWTTLSAQMSMKHTGWFLRVWAMPWYRNISSSIIQTFYFVIGRNHPGLISAFIIKKSKTNILLFHIF